ncbi:aldo/keto reductase [Collinsella ihumii]|uniref:Aldo/keto reductase n=1 Tax=Collinsella ihumii TaxID=1720204 RepID=A0ABT7XDU9_9ACTN|nr:aldo/keto reductase [Collinsella ihumii]MDN0063377.1 aldo/keto reductase [Collinsella ihumii]
MEYRVLPHGGEKISVIGLGSASIHNADAAEVERTYDAAIDAGVNHFDFIPSESAPFEAMGRVLGRHRERVRIQVHIGALYGSGAYGWTTEAAPAIAEFERRLATIGTDYADFGFIHCIDEDADLDRVMNGGIWDYAQARHVDGTIRHLAFSTHNPHIARRLLATGAFDLAMFSLNPMYDYTDESEYGRGEASDRMALLQEFERAGVGVSVMKPFAGGQLLDAAQSPFSRALTRTQCIQYALDRPGVLTVLPGVRGEADLRELLSYLDATPEERDYSVLADMAPQSREARCVYCNHCQPCPAGIQIGLVNKYYDLALVGDELAAEHYRNLEHHAGECIGCGHCDSRCPFGVAQSERMGIIADHFGL